MSIKVSVIVPVYNVEKYIKRCVDSIINQTYNNIEVLLIDDGSTDCSGKICDTYSNKDNRISVFHKANGGLSDARNYGMDKAKGEYLLFVDSDDYLDIHAIEVLIKYAEQHNADIVEGNTYLVDGSEELKSYESKYIVEDYLYNGVEYAVRRIENHCFYAAVWLKLYKKEYLDKIEARFKLNRLHEDELWNPYVILNAQRIIYIDYKFYYYDVSRPASIMNNFSEKNINAVFNNCYELADLYKNLMLTRKERNVLLDYLVKQYMCVVLKVKDNLAFYRLNRNCGFVIVNAKSLKMKLLALVYSINLKFFVFCLRKITD